MNMTLIFISANYLFLDSIISSTTTYMTPVRIDGRYVVDLQYTTCWTIWGRWSGRSWGQGFGCRFWCISLLSASLAAVEPSQPRKTSHTRVHTHMHTHTVERPQRHCGLLKRLPRMDMGMEITGEVLHTLTNKHMFVDLQIGMNDYVSVPNGTLFTM